MQTFPYDYLIKASVGIHNKSVSVNYCREEGNEYKNQMLYYDSQSTSLPEPQSVICFNTQLPHILPGGTKLYFSPKSNIPRDYVRNTHKIVRDPANAEFIVIPDLTDRINRFGYQILFSCANNYSTFAVYLLFDHETCKKNPIKALNLSLDDIIGPVINRINSNYVAPSNYIDTTAYTILDSIDITSLYDWDDKSYSLRRGYSVPNLPEYEDILTHKQNGTAQYLFDREINYNNPTELTPEMLYVMRKNSDKEIVLRSIAATNWKEYPLTTAVFLFSYFQGGDVYNSSIPSGARFMATDLEVTKYYTWQNYLRHLNNSLVSTQDIALLQDWLFKELNIDGKCGYIDFDIYNTLPAPMKDCLRKKMAVSKVNTTQPIMLQDLKQSC